MDDSLLSVVYEFAKDLYEIGIMDIKTMEKIEAIYSSEIKKIILKK